MTDADIAENGGLIEVPLAKASTQRDDEAEKGFLALNAVEPPLPFQQLIAVYETDTIARKCIDFYAKNVVANGWEWVPIDESIASDKEKRTLDAFIHNCNDEMSFEEIEVKAITDELTVGSSGIEVSRAGLSPAARTANPPDRLYHVPIQTVRVARGDAQGSEGRGPFRTGQRFIQLEDNTQKIGVWYNRYRADPDMRTEENGYNPDLNPGLRTNEILWFTQSNPNSRHYGLPPSYTLLTDVLLAKYAREFNKNEFENGLLAKFMVVVEQGSVKEESIRALRAYLDNIMSRGKSSSVPILAGKAGSKIKIEKLTAEIKDMSYLELLKYIRSQIWVAYGIPPVLLGIPDSSFKNTAEEEERKFYEKEMIPFQVRRAARWTKMAQKDFGFTNWRFRYKTPSLDDQKLENELMEKQVKMGVKTINEWIRATGGTPVDGGDEHLVWTPLGMIPVSQLADLSSADFAQKQGEATGKAAISGLLNYQQALRKQLEREEIARGTDDGIHLTPYANGARSADAAE